MISKIFLIKNSQKVYNRFAKLKKATYLCAVVKIRATK